MSVFKLPDFKDTSIEYQVRTLTAVLSVGALASIAGIGAMFATAEMAGSLIFFGLFCGFLASWIFVTSQRLRAAAWLISVLCWLGMFFLLVYASNYIVALVAGFAMVVVIISVLLGPLPATIAAILSAIASYSVPYLISLGILPGSQLPFNTLAASLMIGTGLLLVAGLAYMVTRREKAATEYVHSVRQQYRRQFQDLQDTRQQIEFALQESQSKLETILSAAPTGILITDRKGEIQYLNQMACEIFGYTQNELIGLPVETLISEDRREKHIQERQYYFQSPRSVRTTMGRDLAGIRKDGTLIPLEIGLSYIDASDGRLAIAYISDISERKQAEETLQRERNLLNSIVQTSVAAILVMDLRGVIIFANEQAENVLGLIRHPKSKGNFELPGWRVEDKHGNPANSDPLGFQQVLKYKEPVKGLERVFQTPTGMPLFLSINAAPLLDTTGKVAAVVFSVNNITDLIQTGDELQSTQRMIQKIADALPSILYVYDLQEKKLSYINHAVTDVLGIQPESIRAMDNTELLRFVNPEDYPDLMAIRDRVEHLVPGQVLDHEIRVKNDAGEWRILRDRCTLFTTDDEGKPRQILGTVLDITVRKKIETELQESVNLYQLLADNVTDLISKHSPSGVFLYVSPASETLLGYRPDELIGMHIHDLVHPDDREKIHPAEFDTDREEDVLTTTYRVLRKDGKTIWFETTNKRIRDEESGEILEVVAVSRDITDRQADQEALMHAMEIAETVNKAKSEFLANMSHEIRTPLNAIIGMTSLLFDTDLSLEQRDYVETVRSSGDALLAIINDILDFSKIEAGRMELEQQPFDLRDCIESALDLVAQRAAEKQIDLAYFIGEHVPPNLIGDVTRLRQVLVNLLTNAVKFTNIGEVVVTVTSQSLDANIYEIFFAVQDTGIGIPEERMDRLFEAFSQIDASTTRKYGGSGLGLAISKRLVEIMGGHMWVESKMGEGSTFQFTIQARAAPSQGRIHRRGTQPLLRGKHVLIVDDNATNRLFVARLLENWGMTHQAVPSGEQAIQCLNRGESFDIGLIDLQLPEMNGGTLAQEIYRLSGSKPFPLVMITSLGKRDDLPSEENYAGVIHKPIKPIQLYNILMNALRVELTPADTPQEEDLFDTGLGERHPLRLLLAEDNLINQKVAINLLERLGYRADIAANGLEVLEALRRQPYDVVLMDIQMPEMDGVEASRLIRELLPASHQPTIIAMTAHALHGDRERYIEAGMDNYISKPVRVEQLREVLLDCKPIHPRGTNTLTNSRNMEVVLNTKLAHKKSFDISMIDQLKATVGGKSETLASLVKSYLDETPHYLASMREALEFGDIDRFQRIAHNLKGLSATFGAMKLSTICEELENLSSNGGLEQVGTLIDQAESEFDLVAAHLAQFHQVEP
jgi:PAS domain S-box-containing protein